MVYPIIIYNNSDNGVSGNGVSDIPIDNNIPTTNTSSYNEHIDGSEIVMYVLASSLLLYSCFGAISKTFKSCSDRYKEYNNNSQLSNYLLSREVIITDEELGQTSESEQLTNDCTICLERFSPRQLCITLPCNHTFHTHCITEWFHKELTCPNCRVEIEI